MKTLYKKFKKGSAWASQNKQKAIFLSFLFQSIIIFSGIWIGWDMYGKELEIPTWLPLLALLACGLASIAFTDNIYSLNGVLKSGQRFYMDRIARYTVYIYSTFLIAICCGNFYLDNNRYKIQDVWTDWTAYTTVSTTTLQASVSYDNVPIEKINAKKRFYKQKPIVKNKNNTNSYKGYLAVAFINLMLALACVVGACAGFCVGGALGIIGAVWAVSSFIGCVGMSVVAFRLFGKGLRAERAAK